MERVGFALSTQNSIPERNPGVERQILRSQSWGPAGVNVEIAARILIHGQPRGRLGHEAAVRGPAGSQRGPQIHEQRRHFLIVMADDTVEGIVGKHHQQLVTVADTWFTPDSLANSGSDETGNAAYPNRL